jgi:hypothetical protein
LKRKEKSSSQQLPCVTQGAGWAAAQTVLRAVCGRLKCNVCMKAILFQDRQCLCVLLSCPGSSRSSEASAAAEQLLNKRFW